MIKVVVGDEKAEWMVHEKVLLANSGFARAAIGHNTEEKANGTIFLPEANPEVFDIFHKFLYERRLRVAKLDLDQLFLVYILADYVDCPVFADSVFEVIHCRTSSRPVCYTHTQIQKVLTSTLPDQPLHKLMLDQIIRQILQKKHNFNSKEAQETLHEVTGEVLVALVQTINGITVTGGSSLQLPIENYSKHVSRHASSEHAQTGAERAQPFDPIPRINASESPESKIGRKALEHVMGQTGQTKECAIKALEDHAYNSELAISSLKGPLDFWKFGEGPSSVPFSFGNNTSAAPPLFAAPAAALFNATQVFGPPNPNPITPASSRGGVADSARGPVFGRGVSG